MIVSTRNRISVKASQAILEGLAKDGGLYIFDYYTKVDFNKILKMNYKELSVYILSLLLDDYEEEEIKEIIDKSYDNQFDCDDLVEIKKTSDAYFLELFHGPTIAFKDMALRVLPNLLKKAKEKHGIKKDTIILTATSGDTGGATLSGFKDVEGMKVIVFYPNNLVSKLQEMQMISFRSDNQRVIAYDGNFDDTQSFVKAMFEKYKDLSSSNSINLGRLVSQVVYYFYAYLDLVRKNEIKLGDKINYSVPTGNFGNILACYIASLMGLPVNKLICASNKNNVLSDFFNTGVYDINRPFYKTNSPSMDILISSNLERLLYLIDIDTKKMMEDLKNKKRFELSMEEMNKLDNFYANYLDEKETLKIIKKTFEEENYLIDTHTAVSYGVYQKYKKDTNDETKTVIVSTASPYKFLDSIKEALGLDKDMDIYEFSKYTRTDIPKVILGYKDDNKTFWKKDEINKKFIETLEDLGYGK